MDGFLMFLGVLFIIESCIGGISLALFSNIFTGICTLILIAIVISHPGILWVIPIVIGAIVLFYLFKFIYQHGIKPIVRFFAMIITSTFTFLWKYLKIPLLILFWIYTGFAILLMILYGG